MVDKDVKRWYRENGVEYIPTDWGQRFENGESAGPTNDGRERRDIVQTVDFTNLWWFDNRPSVWQARTRPELEWVETLEDFFLPYIALLPRAKGNLLREAFGDLRSYADIGEDLGVSRQAAHQQTQTALRSLIRRIAEDDPLFRPQPGGVRDYEEEARAARRVFVVYLERRGHSVDDD